MSTPRTSPVDDIPDRRRPLLAADCRLRGIGEARRELRGRVHRGDGRGGGRAGEAARRPAAGAAAGARLRRRRRRGPRGLGGRRPRRADRGGRPRRRREDPRRTPASSSCRTTTLLPGLIDAHTHVLLHPYNEASWDDQVLKEPLALRVCRATNHLQSMLLSGFTTIRDLGTEGAGYADVGLKQAVEQKIIPGPRMLVVDAGHRRHAQLRPARLRPGGARSRRGRRRPTARRCGASCATRSAAAPTGSRSTPTRWGPGKERRVRRFSEEELKLIVETARAAGCPVAAHAMTKEGMRRAVAGRRRDDRARRRRRHRGVPPDGASAASRCARRWRPPRR